MPLIFIDTQLLQNLTAGIRNGINKFTSLHCKQVLVIIIINIGWKIEAAKRYQSGQFFFKLLYNTVSSPLLCGY